MDVPNGMPGYTRPLGQHNSAGVPRKNLTRSDEAAEQPRGKTAVRKAFRRGSHVAIQLAGGTARAFA
jgi:hypothetical protein